MQNEPSGNTSFTEHWHEFARAAMQSPCDIQKVSGHGLGQYALGDWLSRNLDQITSRVPFQTQILLNSVKGKSKDLLILQTFKLHLYIQKISSFKFTSYGHPSIWI